MQAPNNTRPPGPPPAGNGEPSIRDLMALIQANQQTMNQQFEQFRITVNQRLDAADQDRQTPPRPPMEPPVPPIPPASPPVVQLPAAAVATGNWKTEELGYFWPDMPDDTSIKQYNTSLFYKDVHVFVDRVKDVIDYKGEAIVKANLQASLRGAALDWFTTELTDLEKRSLRVLPLEQGWLPELVKRFKPRAADALVKLQSLSYGYNDVRNDRKPRAFAQEAVRHARAAQITDTFNIRRYGLLNSGKTARKLTINPWVTHCSR